LGGLGGRRRGSEGVCEVKGGTSSLLLLLVGCGFVQLAYVHLCSLTVSKLDRAVRDDPLVKQWPVHTATTLPSHRLRCAYLIPLPTSLSPPHSPLNPPQSYRPPDIPNPNPQTQHNPSLQNLHPLASCPPLPRQFPHRGHGFPPPRKPQRLEFGGG